MLVILTNGILGPQAASGITASFYEIIATEPIAVPRRPADDIVGVAGQGAYRACILKSVLNLMCAVYPNMLLLVVAFTLEYKKSLAVSR